MDPNIQKAIDMINKGDTYRNSIFESGGAQIFLLIIFISVVVCILIWASIKVTSAIKERWIKKINNNLYGSLGKKLKEYIYSNSAIYRVYDHAILFYDGNGNERVVGFSQFGYENIPKIYTNVVCEWIAKNIVADRNSYIIEPMIHEFELYEQGTPDGIRVRGSLFGYTINTVPGNPGKWVDQKSLMGYMLYHKSQQDKYSNARKKLNKW